MRNLCTPAGMCDILVLLGTSFTTCQGVTIKFDLSIKISQGITCVLYVVCFISDWLYTGADVSLFKRNCLIILKFNCVANYAGNLRETLYENRSLL